MIFDSHCHPHFGDYAGDRDQVLAACLQRGIGLVAVGTNLRDSQAAVDLASRYSHVWASVGLHPSSVFDEAFSASAFRKLFGPRVVAVGETGLDYFHTEEASVTNEELFAKQAEVFKEHIALARSKDAPLILHIRNARTVPGADRPGASAYADALSILRRHRWHRGVVHCFGGTPEEAKAFAAAGFCIGFTANVTYPKNDWLVAIATSLPLDRILVETDSPYLAPQATRGKRNDPTNVVEVVKKIAAARGMHYDELAKATADNTRKLFGIN